MTGKRLSFWRVAVRPKYVAGLLLALLAASAFAWLGQWQLGRAITKDQPASVIQQVDTVNAMIDEKNVYIVSDRVQNGKNVFWVIANAFDADQQSVTLALGQSDSLLTAEAARFSIQNSMQAQAFLPITGTWLPTEEPQKVDSQKPYFLKSVSISQLINLYSPDKPIASYPKFFVVKGYAQSISPKLGEIDAVLHPAEAINWLSAFYAAEWAVFAGFAVFLWGRTVKDAVDAERLN